MTLHLKPSEFNYCRKYDKELKEIFIRPKFCEYEREFTPIAKDGKERKKMKILQNCISCEKHILRERGEK